jgi:hypothetical protein
LPCAVFFAGCDGALVFFAHAGQLFADAGCDHQPGAHGTVYCFVDSVCFAHASPLSLDAWFRMVSVRFFRPACSCPL